MPLHSICHGHGPQTQFDRPIESNACDPRTAHLLLHNYRKRNISIIETITTADLDFKNVLGIWINTYEAFVVHSANPLPFLGLITSHPKTIFQTGQLGAILLTDALVVSLIHCPCHVSANVQDDKRYTALLCSGTRASTLSSFQVLHSLRHSVS